MWISMCEFGIPMCLNISHHRHIYFDFCVVRTFLGYIMHCEQYEGKFCPQCVVSLCAMFEHFEGCCRVVCVEGLESTRLVSVKYIYLDTNAFKISYI